MRYSITILDKFDGTECYHLLEANDEEDARRKYMRDYPNAIIRNIEVIPYGCLTVGELKNWLDDFPNSMPVYVYSDGERIASHVYRTLAYGLYDCIEIS